MANIVITGANRGIGLALCRVFHARGDHVLAACRETNVDLSASGVQIVEGIELTRDDCGKKLVDAVSGRRIDVVVHNAGLYDSQGLGALNFQKMLREYDVNALGPLRITEALLPHLGSGSKLAFVSSRAGSIADNLSGGYYGYRMSKAALNMAVAGLSVELKPKGIAVMALHPGSVWTDMLREAYGGVRPSVPGVTLIEPEEAASALVAQIDALTLETSGRFVARDGSQIPW